ncbi:hypothetical protein [Nonomuraea typhae]|uniref:Ig-like domain-containing protein n=1 Tax=Nonomuraea typhae TaxID=2603600 RepID=A0ABW7YPK9_9ACTN
MTIKRSAAIVGAALLATSTLAAPAQAIPQLAYSCDDGVVRPAYGSLHVGGNACSGSLTGVVSNAQVTLESGPDAGTYFCGFVIVATYGGGISAYYCRLL